MPTLVGDRRSIFTDQKRENQRENFVEGFLGSNPTRRRDDSAQPRMTAKPVTKPAPAPPLQKPSGWGSWGGSLLNNLASAVAAERTPSPEPFSVKSKIEDPPRGFVPSQPAGPGSMNKPTWAAGGTGDNNTWGVVRASPTPIAQRTSTGPAWGAKPMDSTFGSGGPTWGSGTDPTFGFPNTAGPENIPESAIEIEHIPAPGGFNSSITDKKEETGDAQVDAWGWEETKAKDTKKNSEYPPPVEEKVPETQAEETEEPVKTEEMVIPAEEDEFDWALPTKKKKQSQAASFDQTPSVPNTPDLDNADDGAGGGGGGGRKKKKKVRR